MGLPLVGEHHDSLQETESLRMIRYALDHGVNLLDFLKAARQRFEKEDP